MRRGVEGGVRVHAGCPLVRQEVVAAAAALQRMQSVRREVQSRERQCAEVSLEVCECLPVAHSCARRQSPPPLLQPAFSCMQSVRERIERANSVIQQLLEKLEL